MTGKPALRDYHSGYRRGRCVLSIVIGWTVGDLWDGLGGGEGREGDVFEEREVMNALLGL